MLTASPAMITLITLLALAVLFSGRRLFWFFAGVITFLVTLELTPLFLPGQPVDFIMVVAIFAGLPALLLSLFQPYPAAVATSFLAGSGIAFWLLRAVNAPGSGWLLWTVILLSGILAAIFILYLFDWTLMFLSAGVGAAVIVQFVMLSPAATALLFTFLVLAGISFQAFRLRRSGYRPAARISQAETTQASPSAQNWRLFFLYKQNVLGLLILGLFAIMAVAAPWISPPADPANPSPFKVVGQALDRTPHAPDREHLLGTVPRRSDVFLPGVAEGQSFAPQLDVFHTLIWGARSAFRFGLTVTFLTAFIGISVGLISGYAGGIINGLLMRITDAFLTFPAIAAVWLFQRVLYSQILIELNPWESTAPALSTHLKITSRFSGTNGVVPLGTNSVFFDH